METHYPRTRDGVAVVVSEGLNSVETFVVMLSQFNGNHVSEGLNSVETIKPIGEADRSLSVSEGLNSVETVCTGSSNPQLRASFRRT